MQYFAILLVCTIGAKVTSARTDTSPAFLISLTMVLLIPLLVCKMALAAICATASLQPDRSAIACICLQFISCHFFFLATALVPKINALVAHCPFSEVPLQPECKDRFLIALSLHPKCLYMGCSYKEKSLYLVCTQTSVFHVHLWHYITFTKRFQRVDADMQWYVGRESVRQAIWPASSAGMAGITLVMMIAGAG